MLDKYVGISTRSVASYKKYVIHQIAMLSYSQLIDTHYKRLHQNFNLDTASPLDVI